MSDEVNPSTASPGGLPRRAVVVVGIVVVLIVALVAVLFTIDTGDGFGLVDSDSVALSYLSIFLLVAGDAVIPIIPGETTLNAASTLAAQGSLSLPVVIVAGALGAIIGDSTLFWIARKNTSRMRPQLDRARANPRVRSALGFLGDNMKILLVFGRYVPGLRFVINSTMGLSETPYFSFLPWSGDGRRAVVDVHLPARLLDRLDARGLCDGVHDHLRRRDHDDHGRRLPARAQAPPCPRVS